MKQGYQHKSRHTCSEGADASHDHHQEFSLLALRTAHIAVALTTGYLMRQFFRAWKTKLNTWWPKAEALDRRLSRLFAFPAIGRWCSR